MKAVFLRKRAMSTICILISVGFSGLCVAQSNPEAKPELISVLVSKVKPDMVQEYEALSKNEVMPALKKGGVPWRSFWETGVFGGLNEYVSATPIEKFAQYDSPSPFVRALGQDGWNRLLAKINKCVVENRRYAVLLRPDLSLQKHMDGPPTLAVVSSVRVSPGRGADFENYLKTDYLPALKKAEVENYLVHQTIFGGDANEWVILTLVKNFAAFDGGHPIVRALGQEGFNKLRAKAAGIITSVETSISKYRPDLSYSNMTPAKPSGAGGK